MPHAHHGNSDVIFEHQYLVAKNHIMPFLDRELNYACNVLEIGCAEGGLLKAFAERGCRCYGVDADKNRLATAKEKLEEERKIGLVSVHWNTYEVANVDLIILKDTIEHIFCKLHIMWTLKRLLNPAGVVFISFPPWYMPFGGHQQVCDSFLRYVPWIHLLPKKVYGWILSREQRKKELLEIYDTRLTIRAFERVLRDIGWRVIKRQFYFINPAYLYRYGLKPRKQLSLISRIPVVRDFLSTCVYYLVVPK